jgi:hypothetical protein
VDLAAPGGIVTIKRSSSPRETASSFSISKRWCAAGSNPQNRAQLARLRRIVRLCSSNAAAVCDGFSTEVSAGDGVKLGIA